MEFSKYEFTEQELRALQEDLAHKDGRWLGFAASVAGAVRGALATNGLQGARYVAHRLTLAEDSADLVRDDLAHPRQRPFEEAGEVRRTGLFKQLFTSARELAESEKAHQKWQMYSLRLDTWKSILAALQTLGRGWERQIDLIAQELVSAKQGVGNEAADAAQQVDPLRRDGDADTNTYYDLETGAVDQELLDAYLEVANSLLEEPISEAEGAPARWDVLLEALREYLFRHLDPESNDTPASLSASGLRTVIEQQFAQNADLASLHTEVADMFDVRNVVQAQHSGPNRPANYRVRQLFERMSPHLSVDGDTFPYSEANEEHIRLVSTPSAMEDEENAAFRHAMRGYDDFEWVPTGDPNRIDACHIVHGLPLVQLSSMPELYKQYMSDIFDRRTLHIQAEWADLPEIYVAPNGRIVAEPLSSELPPLRSELRRRSKPGV